MFDAFISHTLVNSDISYNTTSKSLSGFLFSRNYIEWKIVPIISYVLLFDFFQVSKTAILMIGILNYELDLQELETPAIIINMY
jgi:hypothetical protein